MNIRRGLFRLWLVFAAAFAGLVAFVRYGRIARQFEILDMIAKHPLPAGYVADRPPDPWGEVWSALGLALGVPAAVFVSGVALLWVLRGFRKV